MIKSFLPQDTRVIELYGAIGLIWLGLHSALGVVFIPELLELHSTPFWSVCLTAIGLLQLSSVALYPNAEILRVIMSWLTGGLWMWLSLVTHEGLIDPSDVAAFMVGLGNLYASIINGNLVRHKWN